MINVEAARSEFKIKLSPMQKQFVFSDAEIVASVGPMGEGKTFAGGARALIKAAMMPEGQILRGILVRDKGSNIEDFTIPSLRDAFGSISHFRNVRQGTYLWEAYNLEVLMFGVDSLSDLGRIGQGAQMDFLWLEEPAPIIETDSAGIREEVFTLGYSKLRGGGPDRYKWVQFTMNPASENHWTYKLLEREPLPDTEVFYLLSGENKHLSDADRRRRLYAFRDRPDLLARYEKGEWGAVRKGVQVTPEYKAYQHRSPVELVPIKGPALMLFDGWHHPTCIMAQIQPSGRLFVLDTIVGINTGMKQLIEVKINPLLEDKYSRVTSWRAMGDETIKTPDQSNIHNSTAKVINSLLKVDFEPVSNNWMVRRESLRNTLNLNVDGEPYLQLSKTEIHLHEALNGGWHYPKSPAGVISKEPLKDEHSHPGDAMTYGSAKLTPWRPPKKPYRITDKRAVSYAVS